MCVITCSLSSGHSNHGAWWWVGFLDRKVWSLSILFNIFIIRAPRPDNLCRARDSGQTAVLMFLDLSAAMGRAGQHVPFSTHLQAPGLLVSQLASALSQRDHVDTFPSIPFIFKLFLNSVLPHPTSIDAPSLFQTIRLFNMDMRMNRIRHWAFHNPRSTVSWMWPVSWLNARAAKDLGIPEGWCHLELIRSIT